MSLLSKIIAFILSLFGIASVMQPQTQNQIPENAETYSVKVMSYNIYVAGTGDRSPENRNPGIVSLIREQSPDVFGLQEAVYDRIQLLNESLPEYSYVGRGREKNEKDGEFSPVFYKTDKYNLVDSGTFWFSNTPHKASIAWGTVFKRICTWAVLEDKETGFRFGVFNSHWDHISFISRNNSAELLCEKIQEYAENLPVIIMGDFNDYPSSRSVSEVLGAVPVSGDSVSIAKLYNLMAGKQGGTYRYKGEWGMLDQFIVSGSMLLPSSALCTDSAKACRLVFPFLLEEDEQYGGVTPFRTYKGMKYHGGYSDHLPICLDIDVRYQAP